MSRANASAFLRSSASGLPLLSPPKYFRKLFVFHPAHPNSPITVYPFACSFSRICAWLFLTNSPSAKRPGPHRSRRERLSFPQHGAAGRQGQGQMGQMSHCRSPSQSLRDHTPLSHRASPAAAFLPPHQARLHRRLRSFPYCGDGKRIQSRGILTAAISGFIFILFHFFHLPFYSPVADPEAIADGLNPLTISQTAITISCRASGNSRTISLVERGPRNRTKPANLQPDRV